MRGEPGRKKIVPYRVVRNQRSRENERELTGNSGGWRETPLSACRSCVRLRPHRALGRVRGNHLLSHHHLHRPNTDMRFRDWFSRLKKKVKHRLTGSKSKPDKPGADAGGEVADSTGPPEPHVSGGPKAAADETKSNWVSTASATAKLLLRGVRDSADAFPPLKSVAGGLCFILENCEV